MQHFCKFHWITRSGVRHSSRSTKSVEEVCLRSGEKYNNWCLLYIQYITPYNTHPSTTSPQGLESQRLPPLPFLNLDQTKGSMQYEGQQPALAPPSITTAPFYPPDLRFLEPPNDNPVFKPISPMPSHLWPVEECPFGMTPQDITAYPQGIWEEKNGWWEWETVNMKERCGQEKIHLEEIDVELVTFGWE